MGGKVSTKWRNYMDHARFHVFVYLVLTSSTKGDGMVNG